MSTRLLPVYLRVCSWSYAVSRLLRRTHTSFVTSIAFSFRHCFGMRLGFARIPPRQGEYNIRGSSTDIWTQQDSNLMVKTYTCPGTSITLAQQTASGLRTILAEAGELTSAGLQLKYRRADGILCSLQPVVVRAMFSGLLSFTFERG
ncbi:hypothetical protein KC323_g10 [Hortaea werneckii]|nr:hypothetical protein KC323_g10 [Hortaea werneckii]